MTAEQFHHQLRQSGLPLIAILRGITPDEAHDAAQLLVECGFRFLEVPLNSPQPLKTVKIMLDAVAGKAQVGAGTVLTAEQVKQVYDVGGQLIISPNFSPAVVKTSAELKLTSLPGVATPSEAFAAIEAGACGLKLYPAEMLPPSVMKAMRVVLPKTIACLPVGGIQADSAQMEVYCQAGADGFGLGGGLYQVGMTMKMLEANALRYRDAWINSVKISSEH
ncbi:2-dehydro-3-deoxy-6-phosphogalactonate aldolase [Limnobaculum zhutongyuii]|uniref:2-dehydro-3-deoxy-6-phosphogalactonate aldolase n=1 Tax=Limnobaculum zhutongyuii TaxID=2498113 RepID=A0A411WQQ8_9GAMM|nr:2-dehydro-3-deoxy-6-phosphogalactonate aldolase [Limnobaculum zhutongyuii]QBH98496.1 2-dehydro-3-deoxy-6-phosphogalactonate aldolase [Limnobaculum zhutongyuii]TQS90057.1 2-dehydro-3-deoxy-6-phosphogalactonate aldolase [Limnobaculum zhutongyuii]